LRASPGGSRGAAVSRGPAVVPERAWPGGRPPGLPASPGGNPPGFLASPGGPPEAGTGGGVATGAWGGPAAPPPPPAPGPPLPPPPAAPPPERPTPPAADARREPRLPGPSLAPRAGGGEETSSASGPDGVATDTAPGRPAAASSGRLPITTPGVAEGPTDDRDPGEPGRETSAEVPRNATSMAAIKADDAPPASAYSRVGCVVCTYWLSAPPGCP
jgi:hypothetical protein